MATYLEVQHLSNFVEPITSKDSNTKFIRTPSENYLTFANGHNISTKACLKHHQSIHYANEFADRKAYINVEVKMKSMNLMMQKSLMKD